MKKTSAVVAFTVLLAGCAGTTQGLPTESGVDLNQYAGVWYEQARLPNSFQKECAGEVKATYVLNADNTLGVTNQCVKADGSRKTAKAVGRLASSADPQDPAKLEVRFAPGWTSWLPMVWGDYWIMKLEDNYQYSLVGTPDRKYLWVLSRAPKADQAKVKELLDYAESQGFAVDEVIHTP